jgi:hypothetical protein
VKSKPFPSPFEAFSKDSPAKSRDLLVIDDQLVRQKYFAEAHDVLKKIDQMEERIQIFHSTDQRLFDQWYRLTFREDQEVVDRSREELRKVARFHNWVVATAMKLQIEMPQAYALMKEEERLWENGTTEERHQIDLDREARDLYISSEINGRYNETHHFESDDETETEISSQLGQILSHLEVLLFQQDYEFESDPQVRIDRISELPDEELKYWLRERDAAFLLFDVSLSWSESQSDYTFFLRIWNLMSQKQQNAFSQVYASLTGQSIDELMDRIGSEKKSGASDEEDEETFSFDSDSFQEPKKNSDSASQKKPSSEIENLKSIYRKLVRKLHPDLQASGAAEAQSSWTKKVWDMVQKAYQGEDVDSLQRLLKLTLLRSNSLNQLTLDEIFDARRWLEKDLNQLEDEAQHLKLSPAWGFSQKKDYSVLSRSIEQEFQQMLNQVRFQIAEVRRELEMLEVLYSMDFEEDSDQQRSQSRSRSTRARSRRRNPSGGRRGSKSRKLRDDLQNF